MYKNEECKVEFFVDSISDLLFTFDIHFCFCYSSLGLSYFPSNAFPLDALPVRSQVHPGSKVSELPVSVWRRYDQTTCLGARQRCLESKTFY